MPLLPVLDFIPSSAIYEKHPSQDGKKTFVFSFSENANEANERYFTICVVSERKNYITSMVMNETKTSERRKKKAWAFLKRKERHPPKKPPKSKIVTILSLEKPIMKVSKSGNVWRVFLRT